MKKFLAKLIFNVRFDQRSEFDEQMVLVEAPSFEDAFYKARYIGKKEDETFLDQNNQPVTWKFIDLIDLYPLDEVADGEQVCSRSHATEDTAAYISHVKLKSMEIQAKSLTFA